MFNNLIESSSHKSEIKRRGSFFLFTTATYALLFAIAGVASIYAYDARMNEQSLELIMMVPIEPDVPQPAEPDRPDRPIDGGGGDNSNDRNTFQREFAMAATDQPEVVPDDVSSAPNTNLPRPKTGIVEFGKPDANPGGSGGRPDGGGAFSGRKNPVVVATEPPPDPPEPKPSPKPQIIRKNVINSEAISLPVPIYPHMARQIRLQGTVLVQVLIDETGKVVSAQVVQGNPMLAPAAKQAAYRARFSPTLIGDQPVKVSGTITYNFVMQ